MRVESYIGFAPVPVVLYMLLFSLPAYTLWVAVFVAIFAMAYIAFRPLSRDKWLSYTALSLFWLSMIILSENGLEMLCSISGANIGVDLSQASPFDYYLVMSTGLICSALGLARSLSVKKISTTDNVIRWTFRGAAMALALTIIVPTVLAILLMVSMFFVPFVIFIYKSTCNLLS